MVARCGVFELAGLDYRVQEQRLQRDEWDFRGPRGRTAMVWLLAAAELACGGDLHGGDERNIGVPFLDPDATLDAGLASGVLSDASTGTLGVAAESLGAALGQWHWVQQTGTRCLDGSPSGFAVNLQGSDQPLVVYLDSGRACSDELTCAHPAVTRRFAASEFELRKTALAASGFLDRQDSDNVFHEMNYVFVPHCTGDWHAGTRPGTETDLNFLGFSNVRAVVERVAPLFSDASSVIVLGAGAGGFGTFFNFQTISKAFSEQQVHVFNDSGPLLASTWMSTPFQERNVSAWDPVAPTDCGAGVGSLDAFYDCLQQLRPSSRFALATSQWDGINRTALRSGPFSPPLSEVDYSQAIAQLQTRLAGSDQWRIFVERSSRHVLALGSLDQSVALGQDAQSLRQFAHRLVTGEGFAPSVR